MSKPVVSVVIASHNEWHGTLNNTLHSIRETGGSYVEIIVVDDGSSTRIRVDDPDIKLICNRRRLGVGPSRHLGVEAATAEMILITDAHVIFPPGWVHKLFNALPGNEHLVLCGKCLALDENHAQLDAATGEYNGARMVISDDGAEVRWRILSAKWREDRRGQDYYPLSAMMGACYAMNKSWFKYIGGLKVLKNFGCDEELLSIRTIRAGGTIRMFKQLAIGHIFRNRVTRPPYRITVEQCLRNTIAVALTCCPPIVAQELIAKLGNDKIVKAALGLIAEDIQEIQNEQDELETVLRMPWEQYLRTIASIDA